MATELAGQSGVQVSIGVEMEALWKYLLATKLRCLA